MQKLIILCCFAFIGLPILSCAQLRLPKGSYSSIYAGVGMLPGLECAYRYSYYFSKRIGFSVSPQLRGTLYTKEPVERDNPTYKTFLTGLELAGQFHISRHFYITGGFGYYYLDYTQYPLGD